MVKCRIGNYVYFDRESQSDGLLPLLECLRFAIDRGRSLDCYPTGIVLVSGGPTGGDPGWSIDWIEREDNALFPEDWHKFMAEHPGEMGCYEAWTYEPVSCLDPPYAYYLRSVVLHHIRDVLKNFRECHSDRSLEVDSVIKRFELPELVVEGSSLGSLRR